MMLALSLLALALAALPCCMTLHNLTLLRTPTPAAGRDLRISILIPARNERERIAACLETALASQGAQIEVIALDDHSNDGTAEVIERFRRQDPRLRTALAPALPPGWNGKQHACHVLAGMAASPILLFLDADVRLAPDGAVRMARSLEHCELVSGVPHQLMPSFAECLIIPMINTLLLGYLPVGLMRRDARVALAAGCGQLMMVSAPAYRCAGGHAAIRASRHDGLKLPRLFRSAGLRTDLIDATPIASCRMYDRFDTLVHGFLKNATEGMAQPRTLPVWTMLLLGGHVLPWILLIECMRGSGGLAEAAAATVCALACALPLLARWRQAERCREPGAAILLHPFGILATLAIQWLALVRASLGIDTPWRGRVDPARPLTP